MQSNHYNDLVNRRWSEDNRLFRKGFIELGHILDLPQLLLEVLLEDSIHVAINLYCGLTFT